MASAQARMARTAHTRFMASHYSAVVAGASASHEDGGSGARSRLRSLAPVGAAVVLLAALGLRRRTAENCGIIGVVGGDGDASKYLLEGLMIMRNRG